MELWRYERGDDIERWAQPGHRLPVDGFRLAHDALSRHRVARAAVQRRWRHRCWQVWKQRLKPCPRAPHWRLGHLGCGSTIGHGRGSPKRRPSSEPNDNGVADIDTPTAPGRTGSGPSALRHRHVKNTIRIRIARRLGRPCRPEGLRGSTGCRGPSSSGTESLIGRRRLYRKPWVVGFHTADQSDRGSRLRTRTADQYVGTVPTYCRKTGVFRCRLPIIEDY